MGGKGKTGRSGRGPESIGGIPITHAPTAEEIEQSRLRSLVTSQKNLSEGVGVSVDGSNSKIAQTELSFEDHTQRREFMKHCISLFREVSDLRRALGYNEGQYAYHIHNKDIDGHFSFRMAYARMKRHMKNIENIAQGNESISDADVQKAQLLYHQLTRYRDRVEADAKTKGVVVEETDVATSQSQDLEHNTEVSESDITEIRISELVQKGADKDVLEALVAKAYQVNRKAGIEVTNEIRKRIFNNIEKQLFPDVVKEDIVTTDQSVAPEITTQQTPLILTDSTHVKEEVSEALNTSVTEGVRESQNTLEIRATYPSWENFNSPQPTIQNDERISIPMTNAYPDSKEVSTPLILTKEQHVPQEQLEREQTREKWLYAKNEMQRAEEAYLSPKYIQLQKDIENFSFKGMSPSVAKEMEGRLEGMRHEADVIERKYASAKVNYAKSLEGVIDSRIDAKEKERYMALVGGRFLARTHKERYQLSDITPAVYDDTLKHRLRNRTEYRSYRERELALKAEILSERKRNILSTLMQRVNKLPPSVKMGVAGTAIGLAVAGGGWVPLFAGGASIVAKKGVSWTGNRFFSNPQEKKINDNRLQSIFGFKPDNLIALEQSLNAEDEKLKKIEKNIARAGYVTGAVAAKLTAGASLGYMGDSAPTMPSGADSGINNPSVGTGPTGSDTGLNPDKNMGPNAQQRGDGLATPVQPGGVDSIEKMTNGPSGTASNRVGTTPEGLRDLSPVSPESAVPNIQSSESFTTDRAFDRKLGLYTIEKGDNFWDIAEGQTHAEQPSAFYSVPEEKLQTLIDLTRDKIEANPLLGDAIGVRIDGNANLIFTGETMDLDALNRVAHDVAVENGMLLSDTSVSNSTLAPETSIRPVPRPAPMIDSVIPETPRKIPDIERFIDPSQSKSV